MGNHLDSKSVPKPRVAVDKRKRVVVPLPSSPFKGGLDAAVEDNRTPTGTELLEECKTVIGRVLIGLRGTGDLYKTSTAISNLVKSIASIITVEKVEEVSGEALSKMSDDEIKEYASKLMDKLN